MEPAWSIPLSGDWFGARLFTDARGRVIVSTTRSAEETARGRLEDIATWRSEPGGATVFINYYPHRGYAIEPDGRIAWEADKVHISCVAPDGTLVATDARGQHAALDPNTGRTVEARDIAGRLIGWRGNAPITTMIEGAVWVEPFIVSVFDGHLHRFDANGNLLAKHALARDAFDVHLRRRPDLAPLPNMLKFPPRLDLAYHPRLERLIASSPLVLGWTMCLRLDGVIEWLTLPCDACCNSTSFVGETTIVHTSSCGGRLSFLSASGTLIKAHDFGGFVNKHSITDGRGSVCAITAESIRGFDERGEPTWTLDIRDVRAATARDGFVYALMGYDELSLGAFVTGGFSL